MTDALLRAENLSLHFPQSQGFLKPKLLLRAVDGVSFALQQGETLGLVGESGCGKSSLGKALLNLHHPTSGTVAFEGRDITGLSAAQMRPLRRDMQMVFQDPFESLNSRHTVATILEEPLIIHRLGGSSWRRRRVNELLELVGLPASALGKYPHEFSGGQRQRIGIARAIALEPKLLICDEAVSALDVSVQAQILNLLLDIQQRLSLAMLFISHDISVVKHMSDRIAVMYLGELVEIGDARSLCERPAHPYTRALLSAVPQLASPTLPQAALSGDMPSPMAMPEGCRFAGRCPHQRAECLTQPPRLEKRHDGREIACHFWREIPDDLP
ncbi:ABC transporter ATP-binding protein [Spongiibacter marinus]|uniref:ABC transporter ATP-binding protein n=1 Tax=Spongiibacter marinus TaxID=354246 RepID=UPI0019619ECE|nr:oligopeptide/dipeptide ABC transporter ATP-binding protein [Spongiibacter marinus]MBM7423906.1 oligopeptide/dipeptide ABC transporter ATP-binding protein [Spongiibacter marinus]